MEEEVMMSMVEGGGQNTKFFHRLASTRMRGNKITLMDEDSKLEDRDIITNHTLDFFVNLYTKENWSRP